MCRKPVDGMNKVKYIVDSRTGRHICVDCIRWCSKIVKDPETSKVVYLNQYKEEYAKKRGL